MLLFSVVQGYEVPESIKQQSIDESLFEKIANNSRDALEELYRLSQQAVYAFTLSILKNPQDTQDIVQETYLKVRAAAHLYQPRGKPLAWLFTIARNLSLNYMRDNSRTVSIEEGSNSPDDYSMIDDIEDRIVLASAMGLLDESERQVVLLHIVSGMRHREIAENLNQPISTVLSRYSRAIGKLKRHLIKQGVFQNENQY